MNKKITNVLAIGAFLFAANSLNASIVYTNINDTPLATDGSNFDINMDNVGTVEFSFSDMMGPYITFATNNHIATVSNFNSGQGWDVIKGFSLGTTINANSGYYDQGDGFIAPDFANSYYTFPSNTDTYLACQFKIGTATHYGWIRVNWNGSQLTFKDYAYENTPNTAINTGEMSTSTNNVNSISTLTKFNVYPNPFLNEITIQSNDQSIFTSFEIVTMDGSVVGKYHLDELNSKIDLSPLQKGSYFIRFESDNGENQLQKLIKN